MRVYVRVRRLVPLLLALFFIAGCAQTNAPVPRASNRFAVQMNYEGAEALLAVLEQRTVTDAEIDRLLAIRGVAAMVDNTTKYIPADTRQTFCAAVKEFVTTRKSTTGNFRLDESHDKAGEIRALIAAMKADPHLIAEVTAPIDRYLPPLPHFTVTVYGLTGGVSDGFVPDDETQPAFYIALNRAEGDAAGVKLNMTHEIFHVVQRMARARVPGLDAKVFDAKTAPPHVRLLTAIHEEGAATYVAEPLLGQRSGSYLDMWRKSYEKNASPEKIAANFAEVDRLIAGLHGGSMTWDQASEVVFTGYGPGPYFVGYEMAKAIDRRHGPARLAALLQQHPAEFFRTYIELYRENAAAAPAKFSRETERYIDSLR